MECNKMLTAIWWYIRDFPPHAYSLPKVTDMLVKYLDYFGNDVEVTDDKHRDFKVIRVNGKHFRLVREKGWSSYDVRAVD